MVGLRRAFLPPVKRWPAFLLRCLLAAFLCAASIRAQGAFSQTSTRYAFDEVGNRTNQVDALLRETRYEYDALGRRTKRTQPAGQVETYAYNALGSLTNKVDFTGKTTKFFYDVMNRLVEKRPDASFNAPSITYAYDEVNSTRQP